MGIGDWAQSPIPNPQSPIPVNSRVVIELIIMSEISEDSAIDIVMPSDDENEDGEDPMAMLEEQDEKASHVKVKQGPTKELIKDSADFAIKKHKESKQ